MGGKWLTEPSSNPYEFEFDLREDKKVDKELKKSAMMSYLLFENGKITVDKKSPEDRFGILLNEDAKLFLIINWQNNCIVCFRKCSMRRLY